ncbi:nicotinate-nucleotide adenylyltransferase [Parabacteroides sp. PFB2-10]|uniref:nicotinate (nicotinamide) nucleotide adenylyltransferase n=1 Tax=Parabacteroides sp. PFB2-10 TaxID=1742405 RepID=UPI00247312C0|nr:nicotinate (nicotinamide) nucleotide adenylyltransferase [Parabacteroides sp. PFB2-10]MDH6313548.1 nicotinate-nucleotide adenylyltransferase [Parabacteroides sp. PFB2-10]
MIRTGIFSGSFNPIHIGHLALANWLCEYEELDEIWFLITPQNPLKKRSELMEDSLRLEMAEAATRDYPAFLASDFEFHLPRPTYTIDTLRALQKKHPDRSFHFIVGADNWVNIHQWKEYEALLSNFPILIYPRLGYEVVIPDCYPHIKAVDAPLLEISSTFIRESFQKGKDVRFFLPEAVRPYFI